MKKHIITPLFVVLWLCSCTHYYYVPNTQNVPLFKEKNEFQFSGSLGGGNKSHCSELQAAYSLPKNIGVMANFMSAKGGNFTDSTDWAKAKYFEGAVGYYRPIGKFAVFEIYGGGGGGHQNHQYTVINSIFGPYNHTRSGTSDLSFTKLFVQPSFGLTFNAFDVALSSRISRLSYGSVTNRIDKLIDPEEYDKLNSLYLKKNFILIEPAVTVRGGWKYVKMQFQVGSGSYLGNSKEYFEDYHISLGLSFAIGGKIR